MKATLEFDLTEEKEEFEATLKAFAYKSALDDIWNELRRMSKYSDLSEFPDKLDLLEHIKSKYNEICEDLSP